MTGTQKEQIKVMSRFCEQFGLTPSARSRMVADKATTDDDPMELMLLAGGRKDVR